MSLSEHSTRRTSGFTLVQVSILLTAAALVLVALLPSSQSNLTSASQSTNNMTTIFNALRQYQSATGVLPCPADPTMGTGNSNYGVASSNTGTTNNCVTGSAPNAAYADTTNNIALGMVPVKTLGLPTSTALDAYGRDITYAVDTNATACWSYPILPGAIQVYDNGQTYNTVAALISYGKSGHGAWLPYAGTGGTGTASRYNTGSTDVVQSANAQVNESNFSNLSTFDNNSYTVNVNGTNTTITAGFIRGSLSSNFDLGNNDNIVMYKSPLFNINQSPASGAVIVSSYPANGTYTQFATTGNALNFTLMGNALNFTVTFPSTVTVTGTPRLNLSAISGSTPITTNSIGTSNVAHATYTGGTGTNKLTFSYTVVASDVAYNGITVSPSVDLNGGTITYNGIGAPLCFSPPNLSLVLIVPQTITFLDWSNWRVRQIIVSTGVINTIAGTGTPGYSGDGGAATSAKIENLRGLAIDNSGNVYIADTSNARVRKVTASTGIITTVVGNGTNSYSGDGGPATSAEIQQPSGVGVDSSGNIYSTDLSMRIRKVTASTGYISTVAGNGTEGYSGDNGAATSAELDNPQVGLVVDSSGNFYFGEYQDARIRKVNTSTGIITTVAGNGTFGYNGDGIAATSAEMYYPDCCAVDSSGNIYIADYGNRRIRKVTVATGYISTVAGNGTNGFSGDGAAATSAELHNPSGVAVDIAGNMYIGDYGNNRIREVTISNGYINTIAGTGTASYSGDGGPATSATLNGPADIVWAP